MGSTRVFLAALLGIGAGSAPDAEAQPRSVRDRPIEVADDGYVSSRTCRACHPGSYANWYASYHRRMTQVATPETVIPDFDGIRLAAYSRHYRIDRRGDEFWVEMDDPAREGSGGERVERRIVMTTGSHHQQIYWFAAGPDRVLGLFPFLYWITEQRWIPFPANFVVEPAPPSTIFPLATVIGKWNTTCINCHATHGQQRIRGPRDMDTRAAEFGIACEACHGPGERHLQLNRDPQHRYGQHLGEGADSSIVNPADLSPRLASQVCGQCHSVATVVRDLKDVENWNEHGFAYRPGDELMKTRHLIGTNAEQHAPAVRALLASQPTFLRDRFWTDGELRVSGREYNALVDSACFARGRGERQLSCLSCHSMHPPADDVRPLEEWANDQLKPGMDGDAACTGCHRAFGAALAEHTHHAPESEGSRCLNCHMAYTTYGLLKAMRSHRIHSPTATESVETGRPNACNLCHQDRTLAWTADRLEQWYGTLPPELSDDERGVAAAVLLALRGDAGQRALAAWSFAWPPARRASGSKWVIPYLAQLLADPYDAVRLIAQRSLRAQPGFANLEYDFLAPPGERAAVRLRLWRGWHRTRKTAKRPTGDPILIDADGSLDWTTFNRLLRQRDDRSVNLAE